MTVFSLDTVAQSANDWYLSKILNDNNGLPQNSVGSMYFDKITGFLWMTTEAGLVRYDGINTRVFDLRDFPSLKTTRIWYLFPTVRGEILACTRLGEVFAVRNNYAINKAGYTSNGYYQNGSARSIENLNFETKIAKQYGDKFSTLTYSVWLNDSIWVVLSGSHIGIFKNEQLSDQWPVEKGIYALVVRNDFIYVINKDASSYCVNLNNKTLINTTAASKVLIEGKPVFLYDKLNDQPLLLNNDSLYELNFNKNTISAKFIVTLKNLPTDITSVIMHPNKKFVFVSTNTTGVYIYRLSPFRVYKSPANPVNNMGIDLNNNYATVLIDSNHIFTSRSLLLNLSTGNFTKVSLFNTQHMSLGLDSSKNIWSATELGISSFRVHEPGKIKHYPLENGNYLNTIFLSRSKKLWISTLKFFGYENNKKLEKYISSDAKPDSSSFFYLAETLNGRLIGVNKKGIYFIDTLSKEFSLILSSNQVSELRNIHIDSSDLIWITTYGKGIFLYKLKENKLFKLPVDDNGYLLYSHAFIDESPTNFLVPTNKGLFRLNKSNLLKICATPSTPLFFQYFNVSDGLSTNEFNGGCQPAFNRLPNGDIILPALQGLVRVKVKELTIPQAYPLFVDVIETRDKKYQTKADIHFENDERTQTWHLSFPQWDQPNSQNVFYRTDKESSWQRLLVGERAIQLNELTGGDHLLEIRYQYGLLQDQFSALQYKFYVAKKYYETVWFWPAVFVLFAVIIGLLIRLRILRQALNLQTIRNGISADMHDEIGSTLSSISFYSQALLMQTTDEKHKQVLEKIKENAQNVQEGMSDIVWSVKASMDEMDNVFNRMHSFGTQFLESRDIRFHFEADKELSSQRLGMANRKNFYLIFKEAIHNAAKYAECQNIWVKIEGTRPHLRMTIRDDGKGFDVLHPKNGNGLANMQKRAVQMKGRLSVDSAFMKGTTITLVF